MLKINSVLFCLSLAIVLAGGCRLQKDHKGQHGFKPGVVSFIDSTEASTAITTDKDENFFDKISEADILIQMKKTQPFGSAAEAKQAYIKFLATQVSSWTTDEKIVMSDIMDRAKRMCDSLNPRIYPGGIRLIKIKTLPYGNDAYFTRGNDIIIPENIFPLEAPEKQVPVMLHEIFHILSRKDRKLRDATYKMIGFVKPQKPIILPESLKQILLYNPDGLSTDHLIMLRDGSEQKAALPLIYSRYGSYREGIRSYFDYLQFDIFEMKDTANQLVVKANDNGGTTLASRFTGDFFRQIRDNTQYIIHPDEIMADNFMLAIQAYNGVGYSRFSDEGKNLIDELTNLLKTL